MLIRPLFQRRYLAFALLLFLFSAGASAQSERAEQRAAFLEAERALEQGDLDRFLSLKRGLSDYPLLPYLDYQALLRRLPEVTPTEFETFAEEAADTPLVSRLRARWLDRLAARKEWAVYVAAYRPGTNSRRECLFIQGLLALGERKRGLELVPRVWLSGVSQPEACDPVFKAWRSAGQMTDPLVWQRIALAFEGRNAKLARYLGRFLSEPERPWLDLWLRVHHRPEEVGVDRLFARPHPYRTTIAAYGLKRLARREPDEARRLWTRLQSEIRFDGEEAYAIERRIALEKAEKQWSVGAEWLSAIKPTADDTDLHERRVRLALGHQDWPRVQEWITTMPDGLKSTERWRYWLARSLAMNGDRKQADALFLALSEERDYHGFLAADLVNRPYHLEHRPVAPSPDAGNRLARIPAVSRARELFELGRLDEARREWGIVMTRLGDDKEAMQSAAKLAQEWGWHDQAIFTLARTRYWDDLELRFPLEYQRWIDGAAQRRQVNNSWVYAVVRQESAFSQDARSPAGALGLMQLMPGTARYIARKISHPRPKRQDLYEPRTNIALGTAYLDRVLERFDGNGVLATAAYNAGPARVSQWMPEETLPADLWIETIPFKETRRYVQRVLAYHVIYDSRQGREPERLRALMPPVKPLPPERSKMAGI